MGSDERESGAWDAGASEAVPEICIDRPAPSREIERPAPAPGPCAVLLREQIEGLGFRWLEVVERGSGDAAFRPVETWHALGPSAAGHDLPAPDPVDDPRIELALATPLPAAWDVSALEAGCRAAGGHGVLARLRAAGARSGVSLAVHDANATLRVVSLSAGTRGCAWITDAIAGQAALIALLVGGAGPARHEVVDAADAEPPEPGFDDLSDTQWNVLECVREGLPDKLIADRLGMSPHNVDYHLRRLRQRFGARNRVQLARVGRGASGR